MELRPADDADTTGERKVAKRSSKAHASQRPISQWAFLLAGCGFGIAFIAGGVLVRIYGSGYEREGSGVPTRDVATVGGYLIAMGVVAIGLTVFLVVSRRRADKHKRKSGKRRT
jgi:hypothetical protein